MKNDKVSVIYRDVFEYPTIEGMIARDSKEGFISSNYIYEMIAEGLRLLGLDELNYATSEWNPLGDYIKPGDTVLLKPNLVMDHNPNGGNTDCLYTNPSVVAVVIEFTLKALKGEGRIIIGDAPMQECNFERLIENSGYKRLIEWYSQNIDKNVEISLQDFRDLRTTIIDNVYHQSVSGEGSGIVVKLDRDSEFWGMKEEEYRKLRVTNYNPDMMYEHHNKETCEYYINKTVLNADVIINLPKPKTHRKAGVTIAMKNLVGINSRKEYLPHHTLGSVSEGGDEYQKKQFIKRLFSRILDIRNKSTSLEDYNRVKFLNFVIKCIGYVSKKTEMDSYSEGSWYGNDTISKTIIDLNKIILYADKSGNMQDNIQRKYLAIGDMIVSGEGDGPVNPSPKDVGMIVISDNPVAFDSVVATIMGAKIEMIPTLRHAQHPKGRYSFNNSKKINVVSNSDRWNNMSIDKPDSKTMLFYEPPAGWEPAFISRQ